MYGEILEATRLTRTGSLAEATALIQRTLQRGHAPPRTAENPPTASAPLKPILQIGHEAALAGEPLASAPSDAAWPASTKTRVRRVPTWRGGASPLTPLDELRAPSLEGLPGRVSPLRQPPAQWPGQWIAATHSSAAGSR